MVDSFCQTKLEFFVKSVQCLDWLTIAIISVSRFFCLFFKIYLCFLSPFFLKKLLF
jgi:hypothetical protein